MRFLCLVLFVVLAAPMSSKGETYVVSPDGSGDYPTIQAAIQAAQDGDVIELTDGIFIGDGNRDLDYLGKRIGVRSQSGNPETCVIDCQGSPGDPHRGLRFHSGEGVTSLLSGVTVANGHAEGEGTNASGGAVCCVSGSSPAVSNCIFRDNSSSTSGGAFFCDSSSPSLSNCQLVANSADIGGGMNCVWASPVITNCAFSNNAAEYGGGITCCRDSEPAITGCVFAENSALVFGGGAFW
jgi:predicted outer membrane repeat protein